MRPVYPSPHTATHTPHLLAVNAGRTLNQQSSFCKVEPGFAAIKADAHLIQLQTGTGESQHLNIEAVLKCLSGCVRGKTSSVLVS